MSKKKTKPTVETIICPKCKSFVMEADSEDTRVHKIGCKKCRKWLWITPAINKIEVKDIPERASISGVRFYI